VRFWRRGRITTKLRRIKSDEMGIGIYKMKGENKWVGDNEYKNIDTKGAMMWVLNNKELEMNYNKTIMQMSFLK